jgi:hypothetical protein
MNCDPHLHADAGHVCEVLASARAPPPLRADPRENGAVPRGAIFGSSTEQIRVAGDNHPFCSILRTATPGAPDATNPVYLAVAQSYRVGAPSAAPGPINDDAVVIDAHRNQPVPQIRHQLFELLWRVVLFRRKQRGLLAKV